MAVRPNREPSTRCRCDALARELTIARAAVQAVSAIVSGIFQITPSGSESLVYVFGDNIAGVYADVINVGGLLYGTTVNGGPADH